MESDPLKKVQNQLLAVQNALEVSGVGFWRLHEDDRIECDTAGRSLLGLKPSNKLNDLTDFLMQIEESQHESILDALDATRSENKELKLSLRLEKPKVGGGTGLQLSAQTCRLPGELGSCVCGLLQPLPESSVELQKRSESELSEVRSANAELANFASIASHDMREPLRMITSYLRLLKERSPEALDDRARRYIDYACEGADRMRRLIEDLLSYARLDKSAKAPEPLALEDILAHSIDNLSANIRDTKAEVTVAIDHAPIVMGDNVRLTRLFQNLIANAIKFKRPGKIPLVRVTFKDGDQADAHGKWIVRIEDQGIGIHPDHHEMLFKLFQRLNTRDEFEGSGIGLAVSKKIAEQHSGRIWFNSEFGKGSTFYVALNKADAQSLG
jgi:signal transduction histidine kinase